MHPTNNAGKLVARGERYVLPCDEAPCTHFTAGGIIRRRFMAPRRIDLRALPAAHPLARRLTARPPAIPVTLEHDGLAVPAMEGEAIALALAAAGHLALARSPKYHRPRGPTCLRGACDGCLVRVDGTPGVMACQTAVRPGMIVRSQNSLPTARFDLLRATDWFFPSHLDHHHWMVGLGTTVNQAMQVVARQMAGIGLLPEQPGPITPHSERDVDVLVVGAGTSGTAAADELHRLGLSVLVLDEDDAPGGSAHDRCDRPSTPALPRAETLLRASVVALYDDETLVLREGALLLVRARVRLLANGCHDPVGLFVRNDLPGIFTPRAFSRALVRGVLLGQRVVLAGQHPWLEALRDTLQVLEGFGVTVVHWQGEVLEALGHDRVTGVRLRDERHTHTIACDALVTGLPPTAAYELAGQAGASLSWELARGCFVPLTDGDGATTRPGVYATGTLRAPFTSEDERAEDGRRVARRIVADWGRLR